MADSKVRIIIDVDYDGREVRIAERDMKKLERSTQKNVDTSKEAKKAWTALGGALVAGGVAVRELYEIVGEGAQIQTTANKFDALAGSVGASADVLLGNMRTATRGFISDTELMQGAAELINVGIAGSAEEVERFSSVIGGLGLDMQQLTLTVVNQSKMRLDALGLSVSDVDAKYEQLRETLPDEEAWKIAVLESLEDKMGLLGDAVSDTESEMKQLETSIANITDNSKVAVSQGLIPLVSELNTLLQTVTAINSLSDFGAMAVEQQVRPLTESVGLLNDLFSNLSILSARDQLQLFNIAGNMSAANRHRQIVENLTGATNEYSQSLESLNRMAFEQHLADLEEQERRARGSETALERLDSVTGSWGETHARANEHVEAAIHFQRQAAEAHERYAARIDAFNSEMGAQFAEQVQAGADALWNVSEASGQAVPNASAIAEEMFRQGQAAGLSAPQLAELGLEFGLFNEEQQEAFLKATATRLKLEELAELIKGGMSIPEAKALYDEWEESIASTEGTAAELTEELGLNKQAAEALNGTVIDITARYHTEGTPPWQQARQESRAGGGTGGAGQGSEAGGATGAGDFAVGTSFFPGGLTNIHERGPELVSLPRGAMINNAPKTAQMMMKGQLGGGDTHYHFHAGGPSAGMEQEFAMLQAAAGIE